MGARAGLCASPLPRHEVGGTCLLRPCFQASLVVDGDRRRPGGTFQVPVLLLGSRVVLGGLPIALLWRSRRRLGLLFVLFLEDLIEALLAPLRVLRTLPLARAAA